MTDMLKMIAAAKKQAQYGVDYSIKTGATCPCGKTKLSVYSNKAMGR